MSVTFIFTTTKANARGAPVCHMNKVTKQLGKEVCSNFLFLDAVAWCNTISCLYGVGKATVRIWEWTTLQRAGYRLQLSFYCLRRCHCGWNPWFTTEKLYQGLNPLRYQHFFEKMATNTSHVELQNLRPTAATAQYYSLRVYLQVKQWQGEGAGMSMDDWGWTVTNYFLLQRTCPLPQNPFFSYSDVTGHPAVAVWDAFFAIMECSVPQPAKGLCAQVLQTL